MILKCFGQLSISCIINIVNGSNHAKCVSLSNQK